MVTHTDERWTAMRALYEGARPDIERLALATGRSAASIERRAAREKWVRQDPAAIRSGPKARLAKVVDRLIGEVEAIGMGKEGGAGTLDKARIDAISALTRTLEKIGEITRLDDGAKENQMRRDADMAGALKRIDQRIVELATGYAKQLGKAKSEG
ncbi:hypothetical protein [Pseudaminobacter sp. NGMCC 1.201702]|uniref:hypothetical protein n=1 Tax=Pseudaminobacter sp. NGMCC 1.201702 TaxID=3391825 RepID=UPI0039F126B0